MIVQILWQLVNILLSYGQGLITPFICYGRDVEPWSICRPVGRSGRRDTIAAIGWALAGIVWIMIAVAVVAPCKGSE